MNGQESVKCVLFNLAANDFTLPIIEYIEKTEYSPTVVTMGLVQLIAKVAACGGIPKELIIQGIEDCFKQLDNQPEGQKDE